MDVTRVDPEEVLVDYQTIENDPADMSAEIDEAWVRESLTGESSYGKEDKVMVSVRYELKFCSLNLKTTHRCQGAKCRGFVGLVG